MTEQAEDEGAKMAQGRFRLSLGHIRETFTLTDLTVLGLFIGVWIAFIAWSVLTCEC